MKSLDSVWMSFCGKGIFLGNMLLVGCLIRFGAQTVNWSRSMAKKELNCVISSFGLSLLTATNSVCVQGAT